MSASVQSVWLAPGAEPRLAALVAHAWAHSPVQRARLEAAGVDPGRLSGPGALVSLPVMRKEQLGPLQEAGRPFGDLLGEPLAQLARIFLSPGNIYDPQGPGEDYWRFSTALRAAGFGSGDIVLNCFNYHLSPAGFIFDGAARALGCTVIPAGVGQQEMQLQVLGDTRAQAFVGLPSYLLALLERGRDLALKKAFVSAEPLPPSLRTRLQAFGVDVYQGYGTADLGLVAYECSAKAGMHLDDGVMVEICDPAGRPVPEGEVGEVVVTLLSKTYPLIRFGTGDLSALLPGPCACGRPAPRMRGWLGRATDVIKVRGMFLYPRQLEDALAPFGAAWQARVGRDGTHRDRLIIRVEPGPAPEAVAAAVKAATRLAAEVEVGPLTPGEPRIKDGRKWE
ncbi:MAG TPA: AMP-binding protein [Symbiobacteriaceae bacterium]|nr:AMP-binding protein [Symbiobacteriaceae bacterium]